MSQIKPLKTNRIQRAHKGWKKTTTKNQITNPNKSTLNFSAKPVYFNQKLLYVDFVPAEGQGHGQTSEYIYPALNINPYKVVILLAFTFSFVYLQYPHPSLHDSEINLYVVSSLIQFSNDPTMNTSVVQLLDYTLL